MRVIGNKNRDEIELDPRLALERGRVLDSMLRGAMPPIPRGVMRATHAEFNRMDDARMLELARRINLR
jgi:hypothetical protein